jgi:hypothetical protein
MRLSPSIDLGKSLRRLFGDDQLSTARIEQDQLRQEATAQEILNRFTSAHDSERREINLLADEVGLGKTYVALAVAVSLLDAIRRGNAPDDFPSNRPVVLVLTPSNQALFNKWRREAEAFRTDCERNPGDLDWLDIRPTPDERTGASNILDLATSIRTATRRKPMLLIAKSNILGSKISDKDAFRRRALAVTFEKLKVNPDNRKWCCREILGSYAKSAVGELLDLRRSGQVWESTEEISPNLRASFSSVMQDEARRGRISDAIKCKDSGKLTKELDQLSRDAIAKDFPVLPLMIIDEVHNLKNRKTAVRKRLEEQFGSKLCRLLGLSATPFQLRHEELLSVLDLRGLLKLPPNRRDFLNEAVGRLDTAMERSRERGDRFRHYWRMLRPQDAEVVHEAWSQIEAVGPGEQVSLAEQLRPPRISHALKTALELEHLNQGLRRQLRPFVIRHQHLRDYRSHFVGSNTVRDTAAGTTHFSWAPGLEVEGQNELAHYLMMRAVALYKNEKGMPSLGAELTGSYRHLTQTAAVWKHLEQAHNPLLPRYRGLLQQLIGTRRKQDDPDSEHRKVQATVRRVMDFFKQGQKSLVFCVHVKTAEAVRDQIEKEQEAYLRQIKLKVFDSEKGFENFQARFFNHHEPLYTLIQDQPLLGRLPSGSIGIPDDLRLGQHQLEEVLEFLLKLGIRGDSEKLDRQRILAVVEHVAVTWWKSLASGDEWLKQVLGGASGIIGQITNRDWIRSRQPLGSKGRTPRGSYSGPAASPETGSAAHGNPPAIGEASGQQPAKPDDLLSRLRHESIASFLAPYFREDAISVEIQRLPLLAAHHADSMKRLSLKTRIVAGQVFRRLLRADEFLLRYLADIERTSSTKWADFLAFRYTQPLAGQHESLRDRFQAYLDTLIRAGRNEALLQGYYEAATNQNVVQLVKGDTENRDRFFLGFNTPYRPEILVSTSVGEEGIDLHRECRHVIHHDLCWNPATIEQRTGRVDRIGSKVERERLGCTEVVSPGLEIAVPYLAATYDERMFEELYRRAQLFDVTLGGDYRVEGNSADQIPDQQRLVTFGSEGEVLVEDLGEEANDTGCVSLPFGMVSRLRVDLAVYRPSMEPAHSE